MSLEDSKVLGVAVSVNCSLPWSRDMRGDGVVVVIRVVVVHVNGFVDSSYLYSTKSLLFSTLAGNFSC